MCVQEMHARSSSAALAQAMYHNTSTVLGDTPMMCEIMHARKNPEAVEKCEAAAQKLREAQAIYLELFGEFVKTERPEEIAHTHRDGSERTEAEIKAAAKRYAARDYTR